jgi:hypothetical protein
VLQLFVPLLADLNLEIRHDFSLGVEFKRAPSASPIAKPRNDPKPRPSNMILGSRLSLAEAFRVNIVLLDPQPNDALADAE